MQDALGAVLAAPLLPVNLRMRSLFPTSAIQLQAPGRAGSGGREAGTGGSCRESFPTLLSAPRAGSRHLSRQDWNSGGCCNLGRAWGDWWGEMGYHMLVELLASFTDGAHSPSEGRGSSSPEARFHTDPQSRQVDACEPSHASFAEQKLLRSISVAKQFH